MLPLSTLVPNGIQQAELHDTQGKIQKEQTHNQKSELNRSNLESTSNSDPNLVSTLISEII